MRIFFLHAVPTQRELENYRAGTVPSHRLWGQVGLEKLEHTVELCPPPSGFWRRLGAMGWRLWQTRWAWAGRGRCDAVVAVHEISALFLLGLKRLGLFRKPLVVLNLALLHPRQTVGARRLLWSFLLSAADSVASLVEGQCREVSVTFGLPPARCSFIPMLVDCSFFTPVDPAEEERFLLAVGTNDGKDFETLVEALPLGERLRVVTDGYNAAKIRGHRCFGEGIEVHEAVPMPQLREWYRKARALIIPLADTPHGSGHTVFLENMALGKVVIVSGSRGMRGYADHGVNALVVPVGNAGRLRSALMEVLQHPERFHALRARAVADAFEKFSEAHFGQRLDLVLAALTGGERCMRQGGAKETKVTPPLENKDHAFIS